MVNIHTQTHTHRSIKSLLVCKMDWFIKKSPSHHHATLYMQISYSSTLHIIYFSRRHLDVASNSISNKKLHVKSIWIWYGYVEKSQQQQQQQAKHFHKWAKITIHWIILRVSICMCARAHKTKTKQKQLEKSIKWWERRIHGGIYRRNSPTNKQNASYKYNKMF